MNNKNLKLITERQGIAVFLAGSINKCVFSEMVEKKYPKLCSFIAKRDIEKFFKENHKIFVDSGAFTFWKIKRGLTKGCGWVKNLTQEQYVEQYINWINDNEDNIIFAAQLDCIPENQSQEEIERAAQETWKNYQYMRSKLNNPDILLPVFHFGECFSNLHRIINSGCEYVAIGGLVGKPKKDKREFFDKLFTEIKSSKNPNLMTHAFGMTSKDLLVEYPFTSCDSTSWMVGPNNGTITTDYGTFVVSSKGADDKKHIFNQDLDVITNVENYVETRGFTLEELGQDYKKRQSLSMNDLQEWAKNYKYVGKF